MRDYFDPWAFLNCSLWYLLFLDILSDLSKAVLSASQPCHIGCKEEQTARVEGRKETLGMFMCHKGPGEWDGTGGKS